VLWIKEVVPAEAVDEEADGEGAAHPPHGEDGHRERPQARERAPGDGLGEPGAPRVVVEALDDLRREQKPRHSLHQHHSGILELHPPVAVTR